MSTEIIRNRLVYLLSIVEGMKDQQERIKAKTAIDEVWRIIVGPASEDTLARAYEQAKARVDYIRSRVILDYGEEALLTVILSQMKL